MKQRWELEYITNLKDLKDKYEVHLTMYIYWGKKELPFPFVNDYMYLELTRGYEHGAYHLPVNPASLLCRLFYT